MPQAEREKFVEAVKLGINAENAVAATRP